MKYAFLLTLSLGFFVLTLAQETPLEIRLNSTFSKINYWFSNKTLTGQINPYDSLQVANQDFLKLLLKHASENKRSINSNFKTLEDSGLIIATSHDGLLRIYSWDTRTGGSMHIFINVFQFSNGKKVFAQASQNTVTEDGDPRCFYNQIDEVVSNNKKFYLAQSRAMLGSGLSYHNIKVFSIDGTKLNSDAKLIKTKTGVKNQLGYEADLTASQNRDRSVPPFNIEYDKINKTISIPVILQNSRITENRIKYKFQGRYFEKL